LRLERGGVSTARRFSAAVAGVKPQEDPRPGDNVKCEDALGLLCEDLAQAIVKIAVAAKSEPVATGSVLLDACSGDMPGNMGSLARITVGLATNAEGRQALEKLYRETARTASEGASGIAAES
jgi:hypothetical protein